MMTRVMIAIAACICLAKSGHAQTSPPRWEIHDLCTGPKPEGCLKSENAARLSALARWSGVSDEARQLCMKLVDQDGARSYRRLTDCFDDQALKVLDAHP